MAAAAVLNSGYQAFIAIIDVYLFKGATPIPNLVKIDQNFRGRHQYFKIQDGGSRHVEFQLPGQSLSLMCCFSKSLHSYQIWWKLVKKWEDGIHFSKFMMVAAAMLNSGYPAFFYIISVLLFKVVTLIPNLVKFGQIMRERHHIFEIQCGGSRHLEYR